MAEQDSDKTTGGNNALELPWECFETLAHLHDGRADEQENKLRQAYKAYKDFLHNGTHVPNHLGLRKVWNEMPDNFVLIAKSGKEPVDPNHYAELDIAALEAHVKQLKSAGEVIAESLANEQTPAQKIINNNRRKTSHTVDAAERIGEATVRGGLPFR